MKACRLLTSSEGKPDFQESSLCLLPETKPKKLAVILVCKSKLRELSEHHYFTTFPIFTSTFVAQNPNILLVLLLKKKKTLMKDVGK